jgi:hypothetical protein
VDSGLARTGAYGLKIAKASGGSTYAYKTPPATTGVLVARFALQFPTLPTADVAALAGVNVTAGSPLTLRYTTSTGKLAVGFTGGTAVQASTQVSAGGWQLVELMVDVSANPRTAKWRLNGVEQPAASKAETAAAVANAFLGSTVSADVYTGGYDDIILSAAAGDYPFGDGRSLLLLPDGTGTTSGASNFQHDDGSAIGSTTWARVDDIPMNSTGDYVKQPTASSTSYVSVTMQDTTHGCFNAVQGVVAYHSDNGIGANSGSTVVYDGSASTTVMSGDMSGTALSFASSVVKPAAAPWTNAAVNGLTFRFGYAGDTRPVPYWDALALEYDTPI